MRCAGSEQPQKRNGSLSLSLSFFFFFQKTNFMLETLGICGNDLGRGMTVSDVHFKVLLRL